MVENFFIRKISLYRLIRGQGEMRKDDPQWLAPLFLSCIVVLGQNKTTPIALSVAER